MSWSSTASNYQRSVHPDCSALCLLLSWGREELSLCSLLGGRAEVQEEGWMCGPSITIPTKSFSNTKHHWYHRLVTIQSEGGSWPSAGRVANSAWDKKIYGVERKLIFSTELCVGTGLGVHCHHEDWERMIQGSARLNQERVTGTLRRRVKCKPRKTTFVGTARCT